MLDASAGELSQDQADNVVYSMSQVLTSYFPQLPDFNYSTTTGSEDNVTAGSESLDEDLEALGTALGRLALEVTRGPNNPNNPHNPIYIYIYIDIL